MHQPERGAGQAENGRTVIKGKLRKISPCSGVLLSPVLCYNKRKERRREYEKNRFVFHSSISFYKH